MNNNENKELMVGNGMIIAIIRKEGLHFYTRTQLLGLMVSDQLNKIYLFTFVWLLSQFTGVYFH